MHSSFSRHVLHAAQRRPLYAKDNYDIFTFNHRIYTGQLDYTWSLHHRLGWPPRRLVWRSGADRFKNNRQYRDNRYRLSLDLAKEDGLWRNKFRASFDYGETFDVKNRQRFVLGYQLERDITDRLFAYGNADYFQDDFGAFEKGYFVGGGLGYKLILPEPLAWDITGGAGFRSQDTQGPESITENEFALRGRSDIDYQFNDAVSLYNNTEILWSSSDTYIWNEIGITAQLVGNLAARASFRIDNHSSVPIGREKTDTISRIGIVYTMH